MPTKYCATVQDNLYISSYFHTATLKDRYYFYVMHEETEARKLWNIYKSRDNK